MKSTVKVNDNLSIDVEAPSTKELFRLLSDVQEVFAEQACGACKSTSIRCLVRKVEDNEFYELSCDKCHHKLSYGHAKDGSGMYPKRYKTTNKGKAERDKDGKPIYLPNNGWTKFVAKEE